MRYCALRVELQPAATLPPRQSGQGPRAGSPGSSHRHVCDCFSLQQVSSREQQRTKTRTPLQISSFSQAQPCAEQPDSR